MASLDDFTTRARQRLASLPGLTSTEWKLTFQIAAILAMAVLLLRYKIAMEFPAAQFIYGRF